MDTLKAGLTKEILKQDIVDPHTHLREDDMTSHVVDVLSYHWILSELNSVGMDYQLTLMNKSLSLEDRLLPTVPYLARMQNTATYRCLNNIFTDLYGFDEPLTVQSAPKLLELSLEKTNSPGWTDSIFKKANLVQFGTSAGNASKVGKERSDFVLMADLHYLFWPAGATDNTPWFTQFQLDETRYLDAIESVGGKEIATAADLRDCIQTFLHSIYRGRIKYFNAFLPIEFRFVPVEDSEAARAIVEFRKTKGKSRQAIDTLRQFVTWTILQTLNELHTTLQLAVGAEYFICGGRSISRFESTWVSDMVKVCYEFPGIKFDFMNASYAMNHEMEVAAKMIRNFYIQNMWWHTFVPSCIETLYEKLEVVPVVKLGGFYCDAYYSELTYGKYKMVLDSIINVLVRKIQNGIYTEDYALRIAERILYANQKELYEM